jgi:hypothetical protein
MRTALILTAAASCLALGACSTAVQAKLDEQVNSNKVARSKSEALLVGRIFDDRGNRMTPSHVRKRGIKYRYYLSSALLQGQPERAGPSLESRSPRSRAGRSCDLFETTSISPRD